MTPAATVTFRVARGWLILAALGAGLAVIGHALTTWAVGRGMRILSGRAR